MCQRMQCTYTELKEQPYMEMEVFKAFAQGEGDAEQALRKAAAERENVVVN